MKSLLKSFSQLFFVLVLIITLYLSTVILIGVFTDYHPEEVTELDIQGKAQKDILVDSTFTFLSWNIGYAGLGAEMDFFYDGGKMVRPEAEFVKKYTNGILEFLKSNDSIDFFLLQEVDRNSSRTQFQDEFELTKIKMNDYVSSFGYNYKVQFVPIPLTKPLGKVEMGQANFSKNKPISSQRYSYYSAYSWPKRLFMLDRCFIVSRFQLVNGKELVLLNTHNSAYDTDGKLRNIEMPLIRDLMLEEYKKGNYVVAGGDWNQNPPNYNPEQIDKKYTAVSKESIPQSMFPDDWEITFDTQNPTNREVDMPLTPGKTKATTIDFFILSPNVQLEKVTVLPQNFKNSDHEPLFLKIKIKN